MATQEKKDNRTRNWTFVAYPESLPVGWKSTLDGYCVPWALSPLHDADLNGDGTEKKPHHHIILSFEGKKSYEQIKSITDELNCPIPKRVESMVGMVRYLIHLDNPEKHQYSWSDCEWHCGFDAATYMMPTRSQRYALIIEMKEWIRASGCTEFNALFDEAAENHSDTWFPLLCDNSSNLMIGYIRSIRHQLRDEQERFERDANRRLSS